MVPLDPVAIAPGTDTLRANEGKDACAPVRAPKQMRPSDFPKGRDYRTSVNADEGLFLFSYQQSSLVQFLTLHAMVRPRQGFEALLLN